MERGTYSEIINFRCGKPSLESSGEIIHRSTPQRRLFLVIFHAFVFALFERPFARPLRS